MRKQSLAIFLVIAISLLTSIRANAQPKITSFSPASGPIGTTVAITGSGFSSVSSENIVHFGAVRGTVTAASSSSLSVTVPVGATYEPISVATNNLSGSSKIPFNVTLTNPGVFTPATFRPKIEFQLGGSQDRVVAADFDNDGRIDLVDYRGSSGWLYLSRNLSVLDVVDFSQSWVSTIPSPSDIAISDIDGDGKKDIVLSYFYASVISVFKNVSSPGTINFSPMNNITISAPSRGVAIEDINGDGKPEILYSQFGANKLSVLSNTTVAGNISFAPPVEFPTGTGPQKIFCGDLNNDGKSDVVLVNQGDNTLSIFKNLSTSTIAFAAKLDYATGNYPVDVALADIDGDQKLEILSLNGYGNSVSVFKNLYSGTAISFAPKVNFITGVDPTELTVADINGDGKPDVATANSNSSSISLLRNISTSGYIGFDNKMDYLGGKLGISLASVDINNDGKTDIITGNLGTTSRSIHLSNVNGPYLTGFTPTLATTGNMVNITGFNFTSTTSVTFGGSSASSFTVVNDTLITATVASGASGDVVVTTTNGVASLGGFNFGTSLLPPPVIYNVSPDTGLVGTLITITGNNFSTIASNNIVRFGSVNANVLSATANTLTVNVPAGASFEPITVSTNNLVAYSPKLFSVTFPGAQSTFSSNSLGTPINYSGNSSFYEFALTDLDGDGKPDYAACYATNNKVLVKRNISSSGGIVFGSSKYFTSSVSPGDVVAHDLNGDGKPELIVRNFDLDNVSILENKSTIGNIDFNAKKDFYIGVGFVSAPVYGISVRDLDYDGKPEIVAVNKILANNSTPGNISFAPAITLPGPTSTSASAIADFNGDGKPDIAFASPSQITVVKNTSTPGNLSFSVGTTVGAGYLRDISVGDIDGDGKIDIAVVSSNNPNVISILLNTSDYQAGTISFTPRVDYPIGLQAFGVKIGDIDGDGKPDIAATQTYGPAAVVLFKNYSIPGVILFSGKVDFPITSLGQKIKLVDLDDDGKPEVAVSDQVFKNQIGQSNPLPIKLVNLTAHLQEGRKVQLDWKTANEQNADHFDVEHSADGINFLKIGLVIALNSPDGGGYNFLHTSPSDGINYYRLKLVDKDGKFSYSNVVRVNISNSPHFAVYPTITKDLVTAEHPASDKGKIQVIDISGKVLRSISLERNALQSQVSLKNLQSGTYFLVWTDGKMTISSKVIVQ